MKFLTVLLFTLTLFASSAQAVTVSGHYEKISDDVSLFYQEAGNGNTLIFLPGWTMSSDIFRAQILYFSKKYHVIALDPRSQGRSSLTLENNNYTQHGKDLARFIAQLKLKNVTLIGWSWGCLDAYAYMRINGFDNLRAFVCIDLSPKSSVSQATDWGDLYQSWGDSVFKPIMYDRYAYTQTWMQAIVDRKLTTEELDSLVEQSLRTPTYAAVELASDAIYSDYRSEALSLEARKIPTMNFLSQHREVSARKWLSKNAAHANVKVMSKHLMFWEHPEEFNKALDAFLENVSSAHHSDS